MSTPTTPATNTDGYRVDPALVRRASAGHAESVQELWQSHRRWVAAIVLAHMPREADLDDLLQDIAATFVRSVQELRTPGALRPWLRTVAINAARAEGRKKTRRKQALDNQAATDPGTFNRDETADGTAGVPDAADEVRWLLALIDQLPESYREPLVLRCVRGMNYKAISELTGLPETTIETRIARGRRMLRERISLERGRKTGADGASRFHGIDGARDA
ncbi:MAG: sigma-70 family RNA polymerase sigma factor [Phycisphaeraceae bacterium]|nr:sigma-70 family RNA polymerase sigma factor [Phycisphaeraceae bacterium]